MLTNLTQLTLAVLNGIAYGELPPRFADCELLPHVLGEVLIKLESNGLIRLLPGSERGKIRSYELARDSHQITLLDILQATGEHLDCNRDTCEELYLHYGAAARKLGVVNRITRQYLEEIKLTDL